MSAAHVDVVALLAGKNPRAARMLTPVGRAALRLLAHERTIRRFVARTEGCRGCAFVAAAIRFLDITITVAGGDRLPTGRPPVLCGNHPTGGIDGLVALHVLCRRYGGVRAPANDLLAPLSGLGDLLVPIDKYGSNRAARATLATLGEIPWPLLFFPAGRTARPKAGRLREYHWSRTFVTIARRAGRPIVPFHLTGRNSWRFYTLWRIRRALGVRPIIEVALLVDELVRLAGSHVTITFGVPRSADGVSGAADAVRPTEEDGAPAAVAAPSIAASLRPASVPPLVADRIVANHLRREVAELERELPTLPREVIRVG